MKLLKAVQYELGYTELKQINAGKSPFITQHIIPPAHRFGQAAIPAVLIGFYSYSQSGITAAANVLQKPLPFNWISELFNNATPDLLVRIATYAQVQHPESFLLSRLQDIAYEVIRSIKKHLGPRAKPLNVRQYLATQKKDILKYLPSALSLDILLNDPSLCTTVASQEKPQNLHYILGDNFPGTIH
ncbi:hypothetical protein [Deminuibacter soli]|nr:hypothetical protein [Deminuibacter soli]